MRFRVLKAILHLLLAIGLVGLWGCAAKNSQRQSFKEYRKMMERQKAVAALAEEPVKKIPEMNANEYERLGDSYLRQGNGDLAFFLYDKAIRLDPAQSRVRYKIGRLLIEKGLTEEAKKEFQVILKGNPNHALAYEGIGRVFFKTGYFAEAERNFQQALRIDPSLWQAYNFLGIIYDRQGQFGAAILEYKSAITIKPNEGLLFNNLGISLFLNKEYDKAVRAFLEALRLESSSQKIYNNLALALCKSERFHEGLEAFKKGGDEASAHYNMGCIYLIEGRFKEAIENFEKAIQLKPIFYIEAYENLKKARGALNTS